MKKNLGITFNVVEPDQTFMFLELYGYLSNKEIQSIPIADFELLEVTLDLMTEGKYDRIVLYDYEELGDWSKLKQFSIICHKYNMEWSILKQDLHSDVPTETSYLMEVI